MRTVFESFPLRTFASLLFVSLSDPGAQYILGSFYKPHELGKRAVFFHTFAGVGTLCSSALQAATYSGLRGVHGLSGWQWLFVIDAVITLPIAVAGFVFLPPLPGQREANKGTFWLSTRVRPQTPARVLRPLILHCLHRSGLSLIVASPRSVEHPPTR